MPARGAAVVVTSGFAEMGERGAHLQRELTRAARAEGIRVVGPNCLGLLDNQPDVRLDATFAGAMPPPGGLASPPSPAASGSSSSTSPASVGLGVRHFVSLGQQGRRLEQRPLGGLGRRPGCHRSGPLPRVVRQRSQVRSRRHGDSASANLSLPSSAAGRRAASAPASRTPPPRPRRRSGSTRCSPSPA